MCRNAESNAGRLLEFQVIEAIGEDSSLPTARRRIDSPFVLNSSPLPNERRHVDGGAEIAIAVTAFCVLLSRAGTGGAIVKRVCAA